MRRSVENLKADIEFRFYEILKELPNEDMIDFATYDVFETTEFKDNGVYSEGDLELAVRRTLKEALEQRFDL